MAGEGQRHARALGCQFGAACRIELAETLARQDHVDGAGQRSRTDVPGQHADTELVENEAKTVDVAARTGGFAVELFGAGIVRREHPRRSLRLRAVVGLEQARDAEIEQLQCAVGGHQHVAGLEVAMHDKASMRVGQGGEQVADQLQARADVELVFIAIPGQHDALDVLHDQVRSSIRGRSRIDQGGDVGVMQAGEDAAFPGETLQRGRVQPLAVQQLDRHPLLEIAQLALGQVDRAHAALAEQAQQAEAGHFLADQRGCCAADVLTDRIDGAGKRIGAIAIEFEQAFDASRGLRLAVAQFRQPRAARDRL